jgi:hypothetical protein
VATTVKKKVPVAGFEGYKGKSKNKPLKGMVWTRLDMWYNDGRAITSTSCGVSREGARCSLDSYACPIFDLQSALECAPGFEPNF